MTSVSGAAERLAGPGAVAARPPGAASDLFARAVRAYAREQGGKPVRLLRAGCSGPLADLGLEELRAGQVEVSLRSIDQDDPPAGRPAPVLPDGPADHVTLGDLRTIALPPREFGIVCCAHLLDRIEHPELVLDRLVAALRPGGLLLLRFRDRQCAAGLLDRILPLAARRVIWPWLRPGQAGPFPAVFAPLASAAGITGYALSRGLVITGRQAVRERPPRPARPAWGAPLACRLIAALSRGRLTDDHDDLLYVIRNPESRFARVL